jgi:hypothetical protein
MNSTIDHFAELENRNPSINKTLRWPFLDALATGRLRVVD